MVSNLTFSGIRCVTPNFILVKYKKELSRPGTGVTLRRFKVPD